MPYGRADDHRDEAAPDEAFSALGNEHRLAIIYALWEAYDPITPESSVPFSTLYDRVGIGDTGNFNYHLGQLLEHFVQQTDEGYALTPRGFEVARSLIPYALTDTRSIAPVELEVPCVHCESPITFSHDGEYARAICQAEYARAICQACPGQWEIDGTGYLFVFSFPRAGIIGRTPEEVFHATVRYTFHRIGMFRDGICPTCSGSVATAVDVCETHQADENGICSACHRYHQVEHTYHCSRCKAVMSGPVAMNLFDEPAVLRFLADQGIDHEFASWETFVRGRDLREEVRSIDPLRVRIRLDAQDARLEIELDDQLDIVAVERTS